MGQSFSPPAVLSPSPPPPTPPHTPSCSHFTRRELVCLQSNWQNQEAESWKVSAKASFMEKVFEVGGEYVSGEQGSESLTHPGAHSVCAFAHADHLQIG